MNQEFESWWTEFRHNMGAFIDEADASKKAAYHAWKDAYQLGLKDGNWSDGYKSGFRDGKRKANDLLLQK